MTVTKAWVILLLTMTNSLRPETHAKRQPDHMMPTSGCVEVGNGGYSAVGTRIGLGCGYLWPFAMCGPRRRIASPIKRRVRWVQDRRKKLLTNNSNLKCLGAPSGHGSSCPAY